MKRRDPFDEFAFLIKKETATSLGLVGKRLKIALGNLAEFDRTSSESPGQQRDHLVQAACDALHAYLVQKELNGLTDMVILKQAFQIPAEVWRGLGFDSETG